MFYLLIDDDAIFNFVHAKIVKQADEDAELIDFSLSSEALQFIKERFSSAKAQPTILFLDINMPEMNGFELLDALQGLPSDWTSKMSVYIITSSLSDTDIQKSKEYPSIKGYISKPLSLERVKEVIKFEKKR